MTELALWADSVKKIKSNLWQVTVVSDEVGSPQVDFLQGLFGEGSDLAWHLCLGGLLQQGKNGNNEFF